MEREDVMNLTEELLGLVSKEAAGISLPSPFPRLTYQEALSRYGDGQTRSSLRVGAS